MRKKGLLLLFCSLMLTGCWDENLLKDVTLVSLIGIEGHPGEVKAEFAFPIIEDQSISYSKSAGSGVSFREARSEANHRTMEALDIANVEVLLIAEETAKSDLYSYLDLFFRDPRNRLSGHMAIVQGELAPYFESADGVQEDMSTYYVELLRTSFMYSFLPDIDIQTSCAILFSEDMDLTLPYIQIEEESGKPEVAGAALFSGRKFTGHTLDKKESLILNLLKNKKRKYTRISYLWKEADVDKSPLTIDVIRIRKRWDIKKDSIHAAYDIDVGVEEFPHDSLDKKKTVRELEQFLSKEMTKEFNEVVKKMQKAKSDGIGFGRNVRAFHRDLWEQGDWQDTFSELPIEVKVEVGIKRTGILN